MLIKHLLIPFLSNTVKNLLQKITLQPGNLGLLDFSRRTISITEECGDIYRNDNIF